MAHEILALRGPRVLRMASEAGDPSGLVSCMALADYVGTQVTPDWNEGALSVGPEIWQASSPCFFFGLGFAGQVVGGGGGVTPNQKAIQTDEAAARTDLAKKKCYRLLGFSSAADAQKWFDGIKFHDDSYGELRVKNGIPITEPPPANTLGYGQVNINTDYTWNNLSRVPTSTGSVFNYLGYINRALGTSMTTGQLGTLIVIHELEHNVGKDLEGNGPFTDIYKDCIK